ncbi:uncharacterized protein LOC106166852, partial [Lingula anatina]|uniref:Uncharacterized protein LOC106166852 n=1 Tax=Lingula anatina TaxID=7574 RepID=A0A1S3IRY1_LINAN
MLQCVSAVALMVTAVSIVTSGEDIEKKGINVTLADDTEQEILDDSALLFKNGRLQINGSCKQAMFQAAMALFFKPDAIIHMPSCRGHDKWYRRQCVDSLGICWCATPQGTPIAGSQKRGTSCSAKPEPVDPVCPNDQNTHRCNFLTCTMTMCPATGTNCHVNPCGGCKREYIKNHMKTEYDCFKGFSTCGKKMLEVLNSHTSQEKMKVISRLVALHLIFGMGNLA